jgi:hypothetical protein
MSGGEAGEAAAAADATGPPALQVIVLVSRHAVLVFFSVNYAQSSVTSFLSSCSCCLLPIDISPHSSLSLDPSRSATAGLSCGTAGIDVVSRLGPAEPCFVRRKIPCCLAFPLLLQQCLSSFVLLPRQYFHGVRATSAAENKHGLAHKDVAGQVGPRCYVRCVFFFRPLPT